MMPIASNKLGKTISMGMDIFALFAIVSKPKLIFAE
jgi:hypothetical protein